jgi:hypothetical protein
MTALFTGTREPRVKAVISLDPWFFSFKEPISKGEFHYSAQSPALLVIRSTHFRAALDNLKKGSETDIFKQKANDEQFQESCK